MSKHRRHLSQPALPESPSPEKGIDYWLRLTMIFIVHAMVILTPLFFSFATDELFEFNKMILTYFFGISIGVLWVGRMIVTKRVIFRKHWFNWLVLLFLASQVISTYFSIHPYTSWLGYYSRFHGGLLSYMTYTVIFFALTANVRRKDVRPLLFSALGSAVIVGVYGILEHFGHSFSCQLSTGQFNASCWVQDVQNRVFASFGQPNWLAAYALMLTPLALWLSTAKAPHLWHRLFGLSTVAILTWTLIYTKSRSGFFGLLVAVGMYLVGWALTTWWTAIRQSAKSVPAAQASTPTKTSPRLITSLVWMLLGLGTIILAILTSGSPLTKSVPEILQQKSNPATVQVDTPLPNPNAPAVDRLVLGGTDSGEIRKIVWQGAFDVWKRYPLFGSGPETFGYSYYLDRPVAHNLVSEWDFLYNKAHNEFLNFLATTGIVGLVSYLAMLIGGFGLCLVGFVKYLRATKPTTALLFVALGAGSSGLAISNFFGFSTVMVTVLQYMFWAIAVVLLANLTAPKRPMSTKNDVYAWWQYLSLALVSFLGIWLCLKLLTYYQADQKYAASQQFAQAGDLVKAITLIGEATQLNPAEALYWDRLGQELAQVALASNDANAKSQLVAGAIAASDRAMQLNPEQRNFYKSRARIFIMLAQIDPQYYTQAIAALSSGIERSPTDAKLLYNRGLLRIETGDASGGLADFNLAAQLKPNYEAVLVELAKHAANTGDFMQAENWAEQIKRYNPVNPAVDSMIASYSAYQIWTQSSP